MKKIRIGKDFVIRWSIFRKLQNGRERYILSGKDVSVFIRTPYESIEVKDFIVYDNVVEWTFRGKDQRYTGKYTIELVENLERDGMVSVDKVNAFFLVAHTKDESDNDNGDVVIEDIALESEAELLPITGGTTVDLSRYVATFNQSFTEVEKSQARQNIGAVSADYVISVFEEIKELIKNGNTQQAIAVLDNAILDLAILG